MPMTRARVRTSNSWRPSARRTRRTYTEVQPGLDRFDLDFEASVGVASAGAELEALARSRGPTGRRLGRGDNVVGRRPHAVEHGLGAAAGGVGGEGKQ